MTVDDSFSTSSAALSRRSTWAHFLICKMGLTLPSAKVAREYEGVDSGKQVKRVQKTFTPFCLSPETWWIISHPYTDEKPQWGWVIIQGHTAWKHLTQLLKKDGLVWNPSTHWPGNCNMNGLACACSFSSLLLFSSSSLSPGRPATGRKKMSRLVWAGQIPLHSKPAGREFMESSVGIESQRITALKSSSSFSFFPGHSFTK